MKGELIPDNEKSMTRKDYELIANSIRMSRNDMPNELANDQTEEVYRIITSRVSADLAKENPRFDSNKFLRYAGYPLPAHLR